MDPITTALALVNLLNAAAPGIASLVLLIKGTNGTLTVVPLLDEASSSFAASIAQANSWLAAHPAPAPPVA